MNKGHIVARPYSKLETAYFPIEVTFAVDIELANGVPFLTGIIGKDGLIGGGMSLDDRVCLYSVTALTPGRAFSMPMSSLRDLLLQIPELRKRALAYDQYFLAQVQQTAACGALHRLAGRLSSLLLRLQVSVGNELDLTQTDIARMLGFRRQSVTECAAVLQKIGAIEYRRGEMSILNLTKLRKMSCGCDAEISAHFARLFEESFAGD
jgi:CRP-like cAMP-binding protein